MSLPCRVQLTALVITIAVPFSFRILSGAATQTAALSSPVFIPDDPTADRFVEGLMSRMTLSEKLGQMTQIAVNGPSDGVSFEDHISHKDPFNNADDLKPQIQCYSPVHQKLSH